MPEPEFIDWYTDRQEAAAVRAGWRDPLDLIAVGLTEEEAVELRSGAESSAGTESSAGAESSAAFVYSLLDQRLPVPSSTLLGFEIVGAEATLQFHSWHCHDYLHEAERELGVRVNRLGLFDDHRDAERVRDWMLSQPATTAPKPVPWVVVSLNLCA
ncbi:hypothetical protein [Kribbella sp. NPDC006257]|uniref:hypothetical protein n=1 Tax=Kribbella sp. NPDC006257 TaxID=3156738 RepID=UPI0033A25A11